ncbi:hypothetical protein EDB19DRAFT_1098242 [Suillus lakei]|nr:hypothetical protein EDB19DRAFT_1098242 [Suillus lakei]
MRLSFVLAVVAALTASSMACNGTGGYLYPLRSASPSPNGPSQNEGFGAVGNLPSVERGCGKEGARLMRRVRGRLPEHASQHRSRDVRNGFSGLALLPGRVTWMRRILRVLEERIEYTEVVCRRPVGEVRWQGRYDSDWVVRAFDWLMNHNDAMGPVGGTMRYN